MWIKLLGMLLFILIFSASLEAQDSLLVKPYTDLSHFSNTFGHQKFFRLYLPQGYGTPEKRFPVIYFFHGWGGRYFKDDNARLEYEKIKELVDKYNVILVLWDGNISEEEPRPYNIGNHADVKFQVQMRDYFPELVSYIDQNFLTLTDRQHRGIIGFSMGGFMSFFLSGEFPDQVCAAASLHGSPEFFVGYPDNHTLFPLRYTFQNLKDIKLLLHNSYNDELYYLNEEVNKGAHWEGNLNFSYELFPGGHKIDDPGKTEIFEKAIRFISQAFDKPAGIPQKWSHLEIYPEFKAWGYSLRSDKKQPGYIYLKNVGKKGFGIYTRKWLPDGPPLDQCNLEFITAPFYTPLSTFNLVKYHHHSGEVTESIIKSDSQGRLHLNADEKGYEYGINGSQGLPEITVPDYELQGNHRYLSTLNTNFLKIKLLNKGNLPAQTLKVKVEVSSSDSSVVIQEPNVPAIFKQDSRLAVTEPFKVICHKTPPEDGTPSQLKLKVKISTDTMVFQDEIIVPVFFDVPPFKNISIEDRYSPKDTICGSGNGNGKAEPGEQLMILADGHRTRLWCDDPYVDRNQEQIIDEVIPAKWPDGYTLSSSIKIRKDCPKGHQIEILASYETKTFMPIHRKLTWGKIILKVD